MPPRIPISICLRASKPLPSGNGSTHPLRSFSSSTSSQQEAVTRRNNWKTPKSRDPYVLAQAERRKAANLSRRKELEEQRAEQLGDPVRGITTDFVKSFDTGELQEWENTGVLEKPKEKPHLNYFLKPREVDRSIAESQLLAIPRSVAEKSTRPQQNRYVGMGMPDTSTEVETTESEEAANLDHQTAEEAIKRITAIQNGSSMDRTRVNIQRCIDFFGRHKTDRIFPARANARADPSSPVKNQAETNVEANKKRIGPDTGSSEVQIAILTAKIRTLADFMETRGKGDKMNKKNLRQLVHRRQKLLQYLRRKERGGPRWQHCIETLGLSEGTWKGEISL